MTSPARAEPLRQEPTETVLLEQGLAAVELAVVGRVVAELAESE